MTAYPGEALHRQALTELQAGRPAEALAACDAALALSPDHAGIYYDRALALWALEQGGAALASYDAALRLKPDFAQAHYNRGVTLQRLGRLPEALAAFDTALGHAPTLASAWNNRAGILQEMGRYEEALDNVEKALALRPADAPGHYNRGALLLGLHRYDEARAAFERTLALDPAHSGALGLMASSALRACNWPRLAALAPRLLSEVAGGKSLVPPLTLIAFCDDPALQKICAETNLAVTLRNTAVPAAPASKWNGERYGHGRIRIGYLSTDLRNHPVGAQIVGLLEQHDRAKVEVIGLFLGHDDGSALHQRIVKACGQFHTVWDKGDEEIAALVRALEVDILVDLNGQTYGWRPGILKYRPAPVQAVYLGYAGTTGAPFIDYIIADRQVAPFASQPYYSEQIAQLPDCFWPSDPSRADLPVLTRAEAGLPPDAFVFCCFNTHWKLGPEHFRAWMRLLKKVPGSVLWLRDGKPGTVRNLRDEAVLQGVDTSRLVWAGREDSFDRHLARHALADLFLDSFPYNAHVTASDALRAGLPLVTRRGQSFVSRVAASFLTALDLDELITASLAEYEALALALAQDPARLQALRAKLAANCLTQPLFDAPRFARGIEAAFAHMRDRAEQGAAPQAFAVPPL